MIQVKSEQQKEAIEIVLDAMRTMKDIMHNAHGLATENKIRCANAIAALAATLEEKPHFMFGDVNTMDD